LTKTSGADVIKLKGSTVYAPAAIISIMADAIIRGRNRVMSVSTYLKGEYGFSDLSLGVPCVLGKNGVERILELVLDAGAKSEFEKSAAFIRDAVSKLS
jgi:malate dehydrogenase